MDMMKLVILAVIALLAVVLLVYAMKKKHKWFRPASTKIKEREYSLVTQEKKELHLTREAIGQAPRHVQRQVHISPKWFAEIAAAYQRAYSLSMSVRHPNRRACAENFRYFVQLYRISCKAGRYLHSTEKDVQRKISEMQKRKVRASRADVEQIETIIRRLAKIQSNIAKSRQDAWNYTHTLKMEIANKCGSAGRNWYRRRQNIARRRY